MIQCWEILRHVKQHIKDEFQQAGLFLAVCLSWNIYKYIVYIFSIQQIGSNICQACVVNLLQGSLEYLTHMHVIMEMHLAPDRHRLDSLEHVHFKVLSENALFCHQCISFSFHSHCRWVFRRASATAFMTFAFAFLWPWERFSHIKPFGIFEALVCPTEW